MSASVFPSMAVLLWASSNQMSRQICSFSSALGRPPARARSPMPTSTWPRMYSLLGRPRPALVMTTATPETVAVGPPLMTRHSLAIWVARRKAWRFSPTNSRGTLSFWVAACARPSGGATATGRRPSQWDRGPRPAPRAPPGPGVGHPSAGAIHVGGGSRPDRALCSSRLRPENQSRHPLGVSRRAWNVDEWSGRRDSNPRHSAWEADTLPTELLPLGTRSNRAPACWRGPF